MTVRKLTSTDAFVVLDIPDAPGTGIVRSAPKILQGGASALARSASYTFAAFGIQRSGASAGINAKADDAAGATAAFVEELTPDVVAGKLHLDAAKGVDSDAFAALVGRTERNPAGGTVAAAAAGVVAAAAWALGGLDGASIAVEGTGAVSDAAVASLIEAGASLVEVPDLDKKPWMIWGAEADAILAGSKAGTLTHQGADFVKAKAIVPWGPIPVTTKAFASLRRRDVVVVPDFVSAGGALLAGYLDGDVDAVNAEITATVTDVLTTGATDDDGVLLGCCYAAEAFLATWTDVKLFGRPLAA